MNKRCIQVAQLLFLFNNSRSMLSYTWNTVCLYFYTFSTIHFVFQKIIVQYIENFRSKLSEHRNTSFKYPLKLNLTKQRRLALFVMLVVSSNWIAKILHFWTFLPVELQFFGEIFNCAFYRCSRPKEYFWTAWFHKTSLQTWNKQGLINFLAIV